MIKFKKNIELKNAGWLIGGKIARMVINLIVGLLTARYLGPSNYGLVNYGAAYVAFFSSLCTLGINSVIVKDFVDHPDEQGEAIGTSLVLRLLSSILSVVFITAFVNIVDGNEEITIIVVMLCSLSLVFHAFDTINYWFQYKYLAKVTAIATFWAYFGTAVYKVILLILEKDVRWFAFATSVDYIVLAVLLIAAYKKHNGPKISFSKKKAKELLSKSYHYILSGMMVAIYGQTDKFMLKQMLSEVEVGFYSTATTICGMWTFVLVAIIDAMYPTILRLYDKDKQAFERKNRQLYAIVFYISVGISVFFTLFGEIIIKILYGNEYLLAVNPLRIVTWYTAFSYLGVARNAWIVCENKQKYLKYMYFCAAILNVALNVVFIPWMGASGAAFASLITQIFTSIILPLCFKEMNANARLMIDAICLKIH